MGVYAQVPLTQAADWHSWAGQSRSFVHVPPELLDPRPAHPLLDPPVPDDELLDVLAPPVPDEVLLDVAAPPVPELLDVAAPPMPDEVLLDVLPELVGPEPPVAPPLLSVHAQSASIALPMAR